MDLLIHKLESIIDSIELKILHELENTPICIYIGIGTLAGLTRMDDGIKILDDKNYHQFPPALQQLYIKNPDTNFFCIYIDPVLENPVFITQDICLKQKLFEDNNWIETDNEFCYQNNRITIYPFRYSIKVKNTNYENIDNHYLDITECLERLHKLCIEQNILYIYHII